MNTLQLLEEKKGWARISKQPPFYTIILCIIAALLNFGISYLTGFVFKIPLFLDTIFTITILFYCGFFPALFTTFLYSIPSSLSVNAPFYLLFNLCSLAILLITYAIMKFHERNDNNSSFLTLLYLILASLLSGFVSSVIGGFIHSLALILFPNSIGEIVTEKFVLSLFSKNGSLFLSAILGRIPTTCLDRVISTLSGWGIYKLLLKLEKNHR